MPRSQDAKNWQPDAFAQEKIDRITSYVIVTERCAARLRSFDFSVVELLWAKKVQADFLGDPIKYPSAMAEYNDKEGRKRFLLKCQAICFPPKSKSPSS